MKKAICRLLAAVMVLSLTACGPKEETVVKQTASAYLDQSEETPIEVTVDLSGGWSVEFVRGAAYIYDREITEGNNGVGMLITLSKEVYEDHMAEAMADADRKETDDGVYFAYYEGQGAYLSSLNDSAYVMISTEKKADIEAVVSRISIALAP